MFNKSIFTLIVSALILGSSDAFAESLWGKLKDRVKDEVENVVSGKVARKAGDKAGEATDAVLNPEIEKGVDQQATENQSAATVETSKEVKSPVGLSGFGGMLNAIQKEVDIEDKYSFELWVNATQTHNGQTSNLQQWFSDSAFMLKTETEADLAGRVIMDLKNKAIVMLDEKAKTKTVMSTEFIKNMAKMGGNAQKEKGQEITVSDIKRTGKTKKILGYITEQWVFKSQTEQGEVWVATGIDFDFIGFSQKLMTNFSNGQSQSMFDFSSLREGDYPLGLVLESITKSNGEVKSHYLVNELSLKPSAIASTEYRTKSLMEGI